MATPSVPELKTSPGTAAGQSSSRDRLRRPRRVRMAAAVRSAAVAFDGTPPVARRLGCSPEELEQSVRDATGLGVAELVLEERTRTAETLLNATALPSTQIAQLAGFRDVGEMLEALNRAEGRRGPKPQGECHPDRIELTVCLPYTAPLNFDEILAYLRMRQLNAIERVDASSYTRAFASGHGSALITLSMASTRIGCRIQADDERDLHDVILRARRVLDLDVDPVAIDTLLSTDASLAPLVAQRPGLRSPGAVDGFEVAVRGIIGQQISVAAARRRLNRIVTEHGSVLPGSDLRLFPTPEQFAAIAPVALSLPPSRAKSLHVLAEACAEGRVTLDPAADRSTERATLLSLYGIGPWTEQYIAMRAMGDRDILLATDLGVVKSAERHGVSLAEGREDLAPWRSYVSNHLWAADH
ncbi:AlkA N-terminal domain-containing protein [Streptomyces sp. NPDC005356]|uniref:DNA-3-methyladenine glycosylase 2 n=1 Tax=Streptomyces sp. NPDC005356 TaxID=3157167 RepID=UPI0033A9886E